MARWLRCHMRVDDTDTHACQRQLPWYCALQHPVLAVVSPKIFDGRMPSPLVVELHVWHA
jgi:hypothetical protein